MQKKLEYYSKSDLPQLYVTGSPSKKDQLRTSKMVQLVKAPAVKPDDL